MGYYLTRSLWGWKKHASFCCEGGKEPTLGKVPGGHLLFSFLFCLFHFLDFLSSSLSVSVFYSSPSLYLPHSILYFSVIILWIQVWSFVFYVAERGSLGMDWPPMWLVSADPSLTIKHSVHCRIDQMFTASLRFSKWSLGIIRGPWWDADPDKLSLSVNKPDKSHNNHYCGISPPTN